MDGESSSGKNKSPPQQEALEESSKTASDEKPGVDFKMPSAALPSRKKSEPSSPKDIPESPPEPPAPMPVKKEPKAPREKHIPLPYTEPPWGGNVADESYCFEMLKDGSIVETIALDTKSFYVFGRLSNCDIQMNHPSTSRYHAILQYRAEGEGANPKGFYVYDLKSTHGTFLNKQRIKPHVYAPIRVGHMLQIGGSTRMLILQGPEEDAEEESQFTVTELIQQKREHDKEKLRQEALRIAEEKALEEKKRIDEENAGIDWGMGEDADEETDLTENPYASSNNEELYLSDPKKSLRGWFEREGEELQYDCQEKTNGQFLCRVALPIDDANGRAVMAEALVRGKKKEAVVQCALEACRILDRQGLLRKATHESMRSKKKKEWEDGSGSDDDTFLDRTGAVEMKRQRRLDGKLSQKAQTYETLVEELERVREEIKQVEVELEKNEKIINKKESSNRRDQDELDAFMSNLSKDTTQDKIKRRAAKTQLSKLQQDEKRLVKLANIARPATLPELKVQVPEGSKKASFVGTRPVAKPKTSSAPSASSAPQASSSNDAEEEEEEEEPMQLEEEPKKVETKEIKTEKRSRPSEPEPASSSSKKLDPSIPAEFLAKFYEDPLLEDDDDESKEPKKQRVRSRNNKGDKNKAKPNYDDESGDYSTWVPPVGQSGDGRTKLNDKLGY